MSQTTSTTSSTEPQQPYTIVRTFDPATFSINWDLLLSTSHGIIQLSRFDGVLDYNSGGLGEGKFYDWEFDIHNPPDKPGDGSGSGIVHLEQEYGPKLKFEPEKVVEKLNGQWFVPVLRNDDKDILAELTELDLPPTSLRTSDKAVLDSTVAEKRIVLDSVYGPLNLGYYDGLATHITGEMLPVTINPYISDNYEILVDVESDRPGVVETYHPQELLYLLETAQMSCYLAPSTPAGTRVHLLADGREVTEPANADPW